MSDIDINKLLEERPTKDTYYLTLAFVAAQRSFDPSSKCGCIIVSKCGRVLSTGYNGPLKGSDDTKIPLTRPEKYYHMLHSEENALLAYDGSAEDIRSATAYVTGRPCHKCLRMLIQKGIIRIVYGKNNTLVIDQADFDAQTLMLEYCQGIEMVEMDTNDDVQSLLNTTDKYIGIKNKMEKNYKDK